LHEISVNGTDIVLLNKNVSGSLFPTKVVGIIKNRCMQVSMRMLETPTLRRGGVSPLFDYS
ncbi:MAG: hypothetical protein PHW28_06615, partial [Mesotoga sp.]|nr:hypothetical protein [Mesotoga sp.]